MYVCTEVVKFLNAGYSWNTPCDHECVHNPCASRPCSEGVGAMRGIVCNKTRTRQNDEYTCYNVYLYVKRARWSLHR